MENSGLFLGFLPLTLTRSLCSSATRRCDGCSHSSTMRTDTELRDLGEETLYCSAGVTEDGEHGRDIFERIEDGNMAGTARHDARATHLGQRIAYLMWERWACPAVSLLSAATISCPTWGEVVVDSNVTLVACFPSLRLSSGSQLHRAAKVVTVLSSRAAS